MRTSEYRANQQQAQTVVQTIAASMARESTRADWRAVLARRDYKREARHVRIARRSHVRNIGRAGLAMLATVGTMAAALVSAASRIFGG